VANAVLITLGHEEVQVELDFRYYELSSGTASQRIDTLFPEWGTENEVVAVLAPHDDDAILGAGYLIQAVLAAGGVPYVFIYCMGDAGYSTVQEKDSIVATRMEESRSAYRMLGIDEDRVIRFNYPDFSVRQHTGRVLTTGAEGTFGQTVRALRKIRATRLVTPNTYREHSDHEAVGSIGLFDGPQAGDRILVDWGEPSAIRTFLQYTVWADFGPEDALTGGRPPQIRANRALRAPAEAEKVVAAALREFGSQRQVIKGLLDARKARAYGDGYLELYVATDARPRLEFGPYVELLASIDRARS
jgi:LmbE family N-acetylglucosaminyl deacetylase